MYCPLPAQQPDNLTRFWKTVHFVLRKNLLTIDGDVEHAATASFEFNGCVEFLFEFRCQTGSCRLVVSLVAVKDMHVHREPSWVTM